jgi:hypothetical protein
MDQKAELPDEDELERLTELHVRWQRMLEEMVGGGVPLSTAAEAMFTVSVVGKTAAEGMRPCARSLWLTGRFLTLTADRNEAEGLDPATLAAATKH